ncbi:twin-arginine translocation pathway signal [Mycolicibacterium phlei]|uniref:Twin-arginine translocation pathway signal n=1 Tax=Mycolicibacterium phlei DSM 43239 = CCUG 21000 TaxID=1226750 RepID=A0A5N5UMY7_MYCPH|nr:hypothetical protein [Mycolicibacterium phlei]VEG10593.1 twin-arginine translocation pathway signal [Mycobacteroides chelonae]AMO62492.1 hypothetical protein MPHLCCUG_03696 [Mycolicibacterium phlei]KAB7750964.1 hypothetical protein MPHL21000_25385 [Mycolicibacterium phlei DSM 43239 = CCUG 21000]KXW61594.1 hypothetical protein MPHL43239_20300 [Mycolicibacterium phlei DSM 43239 = CCUG 21000]KXW71311.1 hypothetical protein MPHL43072_17095 [Mycolicibacterium phlei DSM 43072]
MSAEITESTADSAENPERTESAAAAPKRSGWLRRHLIAILLTVALLASAGVAAWLYAFQYRQDLATDDAAQTAVIEAARNGTTRLLSYSPESLDQDFAAAKENLTGEFLDYYTQFTEQIVTPAAKQKQVKTSAAVVQAAVSEMNPDSAVVLVFVNQTTVSKENPDGAFAASAVKVTLVKQDGRWLISKFDPV